MLIVKFVSNAVKNLWKKKTLIGAAISINMIMIRKIMYGGAVANRTFMPKDVKYNSIFGNKKIRLILLMMRKKVS